jgi:thiol-disulfide isomerase/thioredoxin
MDAVLLLLQAALAAVFGVAGVAKSYRPDRTRAALAGFGVPERLTPWLAPALPFAEGITGVLLLPFVAPRLGAGAALAMLAVFTAVVARSLSRRQVVDCSCFGTILPRPIGRHTLVRNALLMAAAGVVVAFGPGAASLSVTAWLAELPEIHLVLLAILALTLAVLLASGGYVVQLLLDLRGRFDALKELEGRLINVPPPRGLPVGAFAPGFALPDLDGRERSLAALLASNKPLLLFFVHPDCGPCGLLLPMVVDWKAAHGERLGFALITTTSEKGQIPPEYRVLETLIERDRAVSRGYQAMSIPSALLVRPDGTISSPMAVGQVAISNLIEWAADRR